MSCVSLKQSPVIVDTKDLQIHAAEVSYFYRLNITFLQHQGRILTFLTVERNSKALESHINESYLKLARCTS